MSHTPGPWTDNKDIRVRGHGEIGLALCFVNCEPGSPTDIEARANARLIAYSPDLLEALRPFLPAYHAYVETMQNFVVDGETSAERRFSEGERRDSAYENAFEELAKVTFDQLSAVASAIAKAEGWS